MRSDWSQITSCLAVISSREVIVVGALNLKMATTRFVDVLDVTSRRLFNDINFALSE